ncbi:T9SS type A sorting domain-containing protein [Candidatus Fermentibacteria bacterium]|nr:T9SS type A sorting domain-containing protein [Candidatus Fermentibacteria bacterium]
MDRRKGSAQGGAYGYDGAVHKLPLYLRRSSMMRSAGFRRTGLALALAVFLLPLAVPGVAGAMEVGDTFVLDIPDISQFPSQTEPPWSPKQFTCRAVTEHANWLVQDTSYIGDTPDSVTMNLIWGNIVTQAELDSLTDQFEGAGVNVYGTVTGVFGEMPQTVNDDEKIWIVMADVPDFYQNQSGPPSRVGAWMYAWPADFDGDSTTANNHDIFYVNVGIYKDRTGATWEQERADIHKFAIPKGLGALLRRANNVNEERWIVRAVANMAQNLVYGLTETTTYGFGLVKYIDSYSAAGYLELANWATGNKGNYFGAAQGAGFLFMKYVEEQYGQSVVGAIAQSDTTGMVAVGRAVDPSAPDSTVVEDVVVPLYDQWIVTNLVSPWAADFEGGIYHYDFYDFTIVGNVGSFADVILAPFLTWVTPDSEILTAPAWAGQYVDFIGDYTVFPTTFFNGQYNQNNGSGTNVNGKWVVQKVVFSDWSTDTTLTSVEYLTLDSLYNGTFSLEEEKSFLVITNDNPGGAGDIKCAMGQDTTDRQCFLSVNQNSANDQYCTAYTTLYISSVVDLMVGYDWVGPRLEVKHFDQNEQIDSSYVFDMSRQSENTLWDGRIETWEAGDYEVDCSGYDTLGIARQATKEMAVGYAEGGKLLLEVTEARLEVPEGALAPGQMATLSQSDMLGLSLASGIPLSECASCMTGLLAGPVSVSPAEGLLSFWAEGPQGAVFRFENEGWTELDGYYQSGRIFAPIDRGGIYALGDGPGASSPSVPGELLLGGSYPNPFSTNAAIRFSVPRAGNVKLTVYDLSGRLVRTLVDGDMSAASHSIVWDGCDQSGNELGAGVYFCRLETSEGTLTQKLLRVE